MKKNKMFANICFYSLGIAIMTMIIADHIPWKIGALFAMTLFAWKTSKRMLWNKASLKDRKEWVRIPPYERRHEKQ